MSQVRKYKKQTFLNQSDSAVCIPPLSRAPQCASHHGVRVTKFLKKLSGVHHTAESSSAVCFLPLSQAPQYASLRGVKIEIFMTLWVPLKGQSREIFFGVNNSIM